MWNYTRTNLKRLVNWLLQLNDTPHDIALGVAVGLFISFTPTFGLHMALVVGLSLLVRMNRPAALAAVWVNNPVTLIPVFFFNYLVGAWVMLREPVTLAHFRALFAPAAAHEAWYQNLGEFFVALGRAAIEIAIPLWIGSLIVAIVVAVPAYFIVRRLAEKYQARGRGPAASEEEPPVEAEEAPITKNQFSNKQETTSSNKDAEEQN